MDSLPQGAVSGSYGTLSVFCGNLIKEGLPEWKIGFGGCIDGRMTHFDALDMRKANKQELLRLV